MPILGRIIKVSEHFLSSKNWNIVKYNYATFTSKVEIPSPPKRPLTAYMIFCKENRKIVLKDHPSLSSPDQIKILAEKWSHLSRDMKEPYEVSARDSTLLYGEAHKKFYENLSEEQKEQLFKMKAEKKESRRLLKLKKALKESGIPKPSVSAYSLFVQSQAKLTDIKQAKTFIKEVAVLWKNLPEDSRKVYEVQAQRDKQRYVIEMKKWREKLISEEKSSLLKDYEEMKGRSKIVDDVASPPIKRGKESVSEKKTAAVKDHVSKN